MYDRMIRHGVILSPKYFILYYYPIPFMKASRYILNISRNGFMYLFNTLTRCYVRLTQSVGIKVWELLQDNKLESLPKSFITKLEKGGFVIDNSMDELLYIRERNMLARNSKHYFLILLPTLNCNYHCWYCIQDHVESKMNMQCVDKIKAHINHMIEVEKIESLHIDWFGGEPLMFFDDIVETISRYALNKCGDAGIPFINSSTTNGYYLNENVIEKCIKLKFRHFQITLDGNQKFHDKVKFTKGCDSTFKLVLINICHLLEQSKDVIIYLRINYTHNNIDMSLVDEVNEFIPIHLRSRIMITPCKVWQEIVKKDFYPYLHSILEQFEKSGYKVRYWNPSKNFIPCYANKKYYSAINYNGQVVKCTACNDLYGERPKGILEIDGRITWHDDYDVKYLSPTFDNEKCLRCNKLPICMGLCPREHFNGRSYCKEDVMDISFEDSIVNFIDKDYERICNSNSSAEDLHGGDSVRHESKSMCTE